MNSERSSGPAKLPQCVFPQATIGPATDAPSALTSRLRATIIVNVQSDVSGQEGGRFGLGLLEGNQEEGNPLVLTALEDRARHSCENSQEDVYPLEHPEISGNVSVMPGSDAGANHLDLYLKYSATDARVRLRAEVRSTWITLTLSGHQEPSAKGAVLATALLALASIPEQQMVSVIREGAGFGAPNDLLQYAELLDPARQRAALPKSQG